MFGYGTTLQLMAGVAASVLFVVSYNYVQPYDVTTNSSLQMQCQLTIFFTLLVAFVLRYVAEAGTVRLELGQYTFLLEDGNVYTQLSGYILIVNTVFAIYTAFHSAFQELRSGKKRRHSRRRTIDKRKLKKKLRSVYELLQSALHVETSGAENKEVQDE